MGVIRIICTIAFILVACLALVAVADVLFRGVFGRGNSRERRVRSPALRASHRASSDNNEPDAANHNGHG